MCIVAGIALGILESWIGGFFAIIWQEVASFVVMILVLLIKPHGLFGASRVRVG